MDKGMTSSWQTATNTIEVSAYGSVCVCLLYLITELSA